MENRKLREMIIFNLHDDVTTDLLRECFQTVGKVYECHIVKNKRRGYANYGFVTMDRQNALECVLYKKITILGQKVYPNFSTGTPSEHSRNIEEYRKQKKALKEERRKERQRNRISPSADGNYQ